MNKRKHPDDDHEYNSRNKKRKRQPIPGRNRFNKKDTKWLKGTLCQIKCDKAWYIKPRMELPNGYNTSKDVFLYPDKLAEHILPVMEGDILEFLLGDRDKTRPMARKVHVSQYTQRTCKEIEEYMTKLTKELGTSVNVKKILLQVLPCTAMWKFFGSPVFRHTADEKFTSIAYIKLLFNLFKLIVNHGRSCYKTLLENAITNVTRGEIFQDRDDQRSLPAIIRSCNYCESNEMLYSEGQKTFLSAELVRRFCQDAIQIIPSVTSCLLPTVTALSKKVANESTQDFLCTLLSLNVGRESGFIVNTRMWKELPSIPTDHELAGHLVEKDKDLRPVRTHIPYDNPEQYMDTYFRLIRAETFSKIQHGIKDLKASTLDPRDMNVYTNIHLAGVQLQNGQFSLAIHFTPTKKVKRWEASPQLMYGNLVCISINRRFDDVIWATVSNRDAELLNKHEIIMLELLDENVKSINEIINSLQIQEGSGVMVESPQYYHSLSPILRSLKEFDMENFPLQKEIIYAEHRQELPGYLTRATFDISMVCEPETTSITQDTPGDTPAKRKDCSNTTETCETESGQDIKVGDECISSGDAMCINDSSETVVPSSDSLCDELLLRKLTGQQKCNNESDVEEGILTDAYVEEMDTESISESNVRSKSLPNAENCADTNRLRKSESQKTHEVRMDVKQFLKIFHACSESCLEASQRVALTHALTNKLAVIQGPPGCGKTFIGVKIVQLLLSLTPKLEKPILLLTYKNHALDEFLKHMLEFCKKDDLVRIGSASKEPELESCNLQSIMRSLMRDKSYSKAMFAEIQETRNEIDEVETRIKELSSEMDASGHLTKPSLIADLSEEQLRSLLVEAGWKKNGRLTYRVNTAKFADRSWAEALVVAIARNFGSVKDLLQTGVGQNDENAAHCFKMFEKAFQAWLPDRQDLRKMKEFQAAFVLQVRSERREREDASSNVPDDDGDEQDSGDEEHVKELLETRMFSSFKQGERSKDGLVLFQSAKNKNNQDVLVDISDYPDDMQIGSQIRSVKNLWNLNEVERLQFLYCILNEKTSSTCEDFDQLIERLETLKKRKGELEMNKKVEMLSQKKIIGVTITGASINHDLLHQIGPSVVIVEEAAEILEPSLLAALTPSIEHLILIGDHKQLRPQVDTYELCKKFGFNKSMMERLIDSGFPYKRLTKQNRMRPEFSSLLHDIYPDLEDNLNLVSQNAPLKCMGKSMYFWSHGYPEKHDRTFTNEKEAERIIALVLYLLWNSCRPSEITVLSAYLGQTKLLRNKLKQAKLKHPELFQETCTDEDGEGGLKKGFVQVQTIDMFQGDENKYVLISLVRSNNKNNIGFLNQMNRRCVAQSRAKCGMYFVGNLDVVRYARNSSWYRMINSMISQDCAGYTIPLQCSKHATSRYEATDADAVQKITKDPKLLCKERCGDLYPCRIHSCRQSCLPRHSHADCVEIVDDIFPVCGHPVKRKCLIPISQILCKKEVKVRLRCGHEAMKQCHQRTCDILCDEPVTKRFLDCGHEVETKCHVNIKDISCDHPCEKINSCGKHQCDKKCGKPHGHDSCPQMITYSFPDCKHPSPKKKKCTEPITWKCTYNVYIVGSSCGHPMQKQCYQKDNEVKCPVKPCGRKRKCGHPCKNACVEDCEKGDCKNCNDIHKEKMRRFHEDAMKRVKELEDKISKKAVPTFSVDPMSLSGPTAAEYQQVNDLVVKFVQPMHNWFPRVTKIEKVTNLVLEKKFEEAKSKAFGDHIAPKFHGTNDEGVKGITKYGFRMPDPNPPPSKRGMYGQGIYFATDSSKSAREIYTKGFQKLLLCQVILGKAKTVYQSDHTLNKKKLRSHEYDSVYAPRGSAVINDEFVIFDPDQALPQYIIHFSSTNNVVPPSPKLLTPLPFFTKNMKASRSVNFQDPFAIYYNWAESHFRRMAPRSQPPLSLQQVIISSIDIVINKNLEANFEATRTKFKQQGIPDQEIFAYHGTDKGNISSILKTNLQLSYARRQAYGRGNYFSEFPAVSLGYGDGLLLCRVLPGKEFVDSSSCNIPSGFNSKKVLGRNLSTTSAANASGDMIIIEDSDQILPFFVIHR